MAISIEVKPDFSAFRMPSVEDIVAEIGCDEATAQAILEHYTVLPR
jgi:hypothetical protein